MAKKKTNKVKNKAAVSKKTTAKKKTVKKTAKKDTTKKKKVDVFLIFPSNIIPLLKEGKTLGYFEVSKGEGLIILTALNNYKGVLSKVPKTPNTNLVRDRTESLIKIFQNALKKS